MSCGCGTSFNFDPDLLDMYMGVKWQLLMIG
jgi:hypothetical protein